MNNIKELFNNLSQNINNIQKPLFINAKIKAYYGHSSDGFLKLSFLSSCKPLTIESTKLIKVVQILESENCYWTSFILLDKNIDSVFYSLAEDLLKSIVSCEDEISCLKNIKNRFMTWRKMLSKQSVEGLSEERIRGLFGELYFLYKHMNAKYDINAAIKSWGGPNGDSKDFTIGMDWFEIKTISKESNEAKISSLTQLDSDAPGYLTIIRIEQMSELFSNGESSIEELVYNIMKLIDDVKLKDLFMKKMELAGYNPVDTKNKNKYKVHSYDFYLVKDDFPRIREKDIKYLEIGKIQYVIYIKSIERFKVNN